MFSFRLGGGGKLLPLTSKPFELNLRYLAIWYKEYMGLYMGLEKCTRWPFHDLDPRSWLWYRLAKIFLSARYSENHSFDHCNTWQHYCPKHGYTTWLNFGVVLLETFILANFLYKIWICFFKVKHCFGHISGMVGPIDVKRKGSVSVGYWVQYVTFTFHLTRWPWS